MPTENRIVDDRTFLLGLDELHRDAMKGHERDELLHCARVVSAALGASPADVPVEGYYSEDDTLTEYFRLIRALKEFDDDARPMVENLQEFMRLREVMAAPLYGRPRVTRKLLPLGMDPLSEALEDTFPEWTVERVTSAAQIRAAATGDFCLVGLAALSQDSVVLAALRESAVLYAFAVAGCAPDPIEIVYTWRVDPEITKRARQFVATFNNLFNETLPLPGPEHAEQYWSASQNSFIVGRCVRLGWDDTAEPIRHYHWAIVYKDDRSVGVHDFWSPEIWTTERFRSVLFDGGPLP